jgi:cbb3-type cytochrome c oxidase subunit III
MSVLSRTCGWPLVVLVLTGAAGLAAAGDSPPAAPQDQGAGTPAPAPAPAPSPGPAPAPAPAGSAAAAPAAGSDDGTPLYTVVDGNHVDPHTLEGWHTWRAMACERCHGPNQEGLVGPSLVADLKTMSKEDFKKCVLEGRVDKGMPNFGGVKSVVDNIDNLYAFLKGRSDGAIPTGHLKPIP